MSLSKEQPKDYLVYMNDLKYRKNRNLNTGKIIWNEDRVRQMYESIDLDTLDYRFYECRKTGMTNLDLSNMDLVLFPSIPPEYTRSIKCLFINDNELETIPDLSSFQRLEVLEISCNNIKDLGRLPPSLIELNCKSNKLYSLPPQQEIPNLLRLDCSQNEITEIPKYTKLISLICTNNKITHISDLPNLQKLICHNNMITFIGSCVDLRYLDCSSNKLIHLRDDYRNLIDLICCWNNITELNPYDNVKYLEIFNTPVDAIPFMPNLSELLCDKKTVKKIARQYTTDRDLVIKLHKDKIIITFNKK